MNLPMLLLPSYSPDSDVRYLHHKSVRDRFTSVSRRQSIRAPDLDETALMIDRSRIYRHVDALLDAHVLG